MKVSVSVLIPVKNEGQNIRRCLSALTWANEIWVVDSNSTDDTLLVASEFQCKIAQFDFNGIWPKKKNWALDSLPFLNEWVLIIDADEVLHASARDEIEKIVLGGCGDFSGYWINRRFMFMGEWLRHAYYPNWNLRLFKHRLGRYEKLTDSATNSGDNEVHEHIVLKGAAGRLSCEMDHFAFPSIDVFVEKHNRYSNWEAAVALDRHLTGSSRELNFSRVGFRRRLKSISHRLPFRPLLRFLYVYFIEGGIWDGRAGYYFAQMHGMYELLCVAKTEELKRRKKIRLGSS